MIRVLIVRIKYVKNNGKRAILFIPVAECLPIFPLQSLFLLRIPYRAILSYMIETSTPEPQEKQLQFDKRYLQMAKIWAANSYCKRRQVGALLVSGKMIISDGFNGTPAGFENVCEDEHFVTKPYVLHAEANAITKVAKSNNSSEGSTLYVTTSPCLECAKLIIQSGIRRVVYSDRYHNTDGLQLLEKAGVATQFLDLSPDL